MNSLQKKLFLFFLIVVAFAASYARAADYVVYSGNLPPFNYRNDEGKAAGICFDLFSEMMALRGKIFDADKVVFSQWNQSLKTVEETPGTALMSAVLTPEREHKFKWVGPVASMTLGVIAKKSREIRIDSKADLRKFSIAAIRGSAAVSILEAGYDIPERNLLLAGSREDLFALFANGAVDMIVTNSMAAPILIREFGLLPQDYEMVHVFSDLRLFFLFNKETDARLIEQFQTILLELRRNRYDSIVEKYLGESGPLHIQTR